MKKKNYFIPLLFSFLLVSCINSDNYGFPSRVTFNREGGTTICSGTSDCYYVGISPIMEMKRQLISQKMVIR